MAWRPQQPVACELRLSMVAHGARDLVIIPKYVVDDKPGLTPTYLALGHIVLYTWTQDTIVLLQYLPLPQRKSQRAGAIGCSCWISTYLPNMHMLPA